MKKYIIVVFGSAVVVAAVWGTIVYLPKLVSFVRGVKPVISPPPQSLASLVFNSTGLPLTLPPGFSISIFAKNLPDARVMTFDPSGRLVVSLTSEGKVVALPDEDVNHQADRSITVVQGLKNPHGLAFDCQGNAAVQQCRLYVADSDQILSFAYDQSTALASDQKTIDTLPSGAGHFTRTIAFGPDGRLYVSTGSSCNVCNEADSRRAAIYSMNKDGSDFRQYAGGLRNSVFFTWSLADGRMWGTEMGRDYLGDDLPPDEINILKVGSNYGWPICYGHNIHDTNFDKNVYIQDPCNGKEPSHIDLPAHSAPLGLAFVPQQGWPQEYQGNLLVAYHGSWNRTTPTGYKIIRIKLDAKGNYLGTEDFITGWLTKDGALGRPVDIITQPGGIMYISDDKIGVIYRVTYDQGEAAQFVHVKQPQPQDVVQSPLTVAGEARGSWFFEGSFPIKLLDEQGHELAHAIATAQGDWMTDNFVPFTAKLDFTPPLSGSGTLILQKDNPSGKPENDASVNVPIRFPTK
jgi:glucose/arabinose dehydrogenase